MENEGKEEVEIKDEEETSEKNIKQSSKNKLSMLYNVPFKLTVELGQGKLTIRDLLQLGQGSVLELEKLAGEPLEVLINDNLVSRGEVVVVNDKYGIRLTDVINSDEQATTKG